MKRSRVDYHIHPEYSIDAAPVKISDYCRQAVELGLAEICFTTHLELDKKRQHIDNFVVLNGKKHPVRDLRWLDAYFKEIDDAQQEFRSDGLKVKAGIEIGYELRLENEIDTILNNYPFDFVLGAIHCLDHIAISSMKESPRYFMQNSLTQLRHQYFGILQEAVKTGFFDCLAHVDLYCRYGIKYYGPGVKTVHRGAIEPVLEEMARLGTGLEINTSSLRRGLQEFHPCREIISLAAEAGVNVFTVGSDAHRLEDLGEYIDDALDLLSEYGLSCYTFTKRCGRPLDTSAACEKNAGLALEDFVSCESS